MNKYTGIKVKVYIAEIAEKEVPVLIGGQRDATLNLDLSEIDISSKDEEGGWEEVIGGQRGWNIALNGAHTTNDKAYEMLEDGMLQKDHTPEIGTFRAYMEMPSGNCYIGRILITNLSKAAPYQDLVTYSATFKGVGPLVKDKMPDSFTPPEETEKTTKDSGVEELLKTNTTKKESK